MTRALLLATILAAAVPFHTHADDAGKKAGKKPEGPIRALLVTGGCCHDYGNQKEILPKGISARAPVEWTIAHQGGSSTNAKISVYEDPNWADEFDVIVHNECFAHQRDLKWLDRILKPHRDGKPAVVIHCAMHCYRAKTQEWFEFVGVTSHRHGSHYPFEVLNLAEKDPIMAKLGKSWMTPKGELYLISKVWPNATPLAHAMSKDTKKHEVCVWKNLFGKKKTRVFGTTIGHHNETMAQDEYIDMVTRGLLWSVNRLDEKLIETHTKSGASPTIHELKKKPTAEPKKTEPKKPAPKKTGPKKTGPKKTGPKKTDTPKTASGKLVPKNLAFGKKASASSTQGGRPASDALDGVNGTRWCASNGSAPQWFQVDLGEPENVKSCAIRWEFPDAPYGYTVEGSSDGKAWRKLADASDMKRRATVHQHNVDGKGVRYLRISVSKLNPGAWASIWELSVYGDELVDAVAQMAAEEKRQRSGKLRSVKAPPEFDVTLFAEPPDISYPTAVCTGPQGEVFVSIDENSSLGRGTNRGRIVRCVDTDQDGVADEFTKFVPQIESPRGTFFDGEWLYVIHQPFFSRYRDTNGDGVADDSEVLVKGIGFTLKERPADHTSNGVRMGIDGWLYLAIGDFGFRNAVAKDGTKLELHGGGVVRVRPDGTELELYCFGNRNIYDVAVSPLLDGFVRDNTNDGGGWDIRMSHIVQHAHYGYPSLYKRFNDEILQPLAIYGTGSGTAALWTYESALPKGFENTLFTCDWGRNHIYRHPLAAKGSSFTAQQERFLQIPRPTDLDVDAAGNITAASWQGGQYRYGGPNVGFLVQLRPKDRAGPGTQLPDLSKLAPTDLVKLIARPSHVAAIQAQRELHRRKDGFSESVVAGLRAIIDSDESIETRVAALFTLKQGLGTKATKDLVAFAKDASLREFALRALADRRSELDGVPSDLFVAALNDANDRVRLQALAGLARIGNTEPASKMIPLTSDEDPVLVHSAVKALVLLNAHDALVDSVVAGRHLRGSFQALRELHSSETVSRLIDALAESENAEARQGLATTLARLYFREAPWDGKSWGTRPDTTGPYYRHETWGDSGRIAAALLDAAAKDEALAPHIFAQLDRHRVSLPEATGKIVALASKNDELLPLAVSALSRQQKIDGAGQAIFAKAVARAAGSDPASKRESFAKLLRLAGERRTSKPAREAIRRALDEAWKDAGNKPALLGATADTKFRPFSVRVITHLDDEDPEIKKQALVAAKRMKLKRENAKVPTEAPPVKKGPTVAKLGIGKATKRALAAKGDLKLGAKLFEESKCGNCHTVSPKEKIKGPFLGGIGTRYNPAQVAESILEPSKTVAQGFPTQVLVLNTGQVVQGFVVQESADEVEIRGGEGEPALIKKSTILQRKTDKGSVMPKGLVDKLSPEELASLIAYLRSLPAK